MPNYSITHVWSTSYNATKKIITYETVIYIFNRQIGEYIGFKKRYIPLIIIIILLIIIPSQHA